MNLINTLPQTIYCERGASQTLFAEPINVLTNLTFFLVGFLAYKLLKNKKIKDKQLLILPWLLYLVGIGSFIYHTQRTSISLLFDAIPIYIFIVYALYLTLRELFQSQLKAGVVLLGFLALEIVLSLYIPREFMNGSIRHIVAIIFIALIGRIAFKKFDKQVLKPLTEVIILYALAILFRSIDITICSVVPFGTHFLWHILAALAGYQAIVLITVLKTSQKSA